ncbi:MAG: DUF4394 domain-containing protein [Gammaproteobacteria bacterium]|nr:DUF4394 domain-containing protein [Gammaproteobacteria bacterium]
MRKLAIPILLTAAALCGCTKGHTAYTLTSAGHLLQFSTDKPGKIENDVALSGLASGQSVVQMQFRPVDGRLYCLTNGAQVCVIDTSTGAVTPVGSGPFVTAALADPQVDFDPVAGDLRVIATAKNLRVLPDTSVLEASDTAPDYAAGDVNVNVAPNLAGIAYNNNRTGNTSTTLYALDQSTQSLVRIGSFGGSPDAAATGLLFTVGTLGVNFGSNDGFDIDGLGTAFALLAPNGAGASLYTINLTSGVATLVGALDQGDRTVIALAVAPD